MNAGSPHLGLEELIAEVNGEVADDRVRVHLAACPGCRVEARRWGAVADGVRHLVAAAPSPSGLPGAALAGGGEAGGSAPRQGRLPVLASRKPRRVLVATGAAAALAVVAGAAVAVTAVLPGGGHPVKAQPAAWTVAKLADGSISVTIRELRDPAGLQARLRADGVPASVRFTPFRRGQPNPCRGYDGSQALQHKVIQNLRPGHRQEQTTFLIIHPSALPGGAGVGLQVTSGAGYVHRTGGGRLGVALVQASPACTGS